jgi:pimeloyl-ACP methyl ester carboxylesterase
VAPWLTSASDRVIVPDLRGSGTTRFLSDGTPRNGQQSVLAVDGIAVLDALHLEQAIVAGYGWGAGIWARRTVRHGSCGKRRRRPAP